MISLIPKKDKSLLELKNWRPISLLQTDYKIVAKCLASRLQSALKKLIHSDQTGFIKGRYVGENVRKLLDIVEYCDEKQTEALLVAIDFEKAFDKLEWNYVQKCLHRFNFGPELRAWTKVLYTDISSCVMNNGWSSEFFSLGRGVRQGCPLSPYLFILCTEMLAINVRADPGIEGISWKTTESKISLFADDTTLVVGQLRIPCIICLIHSNNFKT